MSPLVPPLRITPFPQVFANLALRPIVPGYQISILPQFFTCRLTIENLRKGPQDDIRRVLSFPTVFFHIPVFFGVLPTPVVAVVSVIPIGIGELIDNPEIRPTTIGYGYSAVTRFPAFTLYARLGRMLPDHADFLYFRISRSKRKPALFRGEAVALAPNHMFYIS